MADPAASSPHARPDPLAGKLGMWIFLCSEALLFGALFIAYAAYLRLFHVSFAQGSRELNRLLGAGNTLLLLTSSLTMALAVAALARGATRRCLGLLAATFLLGAAFLGVKAFEWGHKIDHGIYPHSAAMLLRPDGEQTFYGLYYVLTGLHALHVAAGLGLILAVASMAARGRAGPDRLGWIENTGLYWHLVDIVWIFLFPLFYLVR